VASVTIAISAIADMRCVSGLGDLWYRAVHACLFSVNVGILLGVDIPVLGPLVVVSAHLAGVLLVVVLVGVDEVIGLAPPGVVVRAVSLLGPCVGIVGTSGGLLARGGLDVVSRSFAAISVSAVGDTALAVSTVSGDTTVGFVSVVSTGSSTVVRGSTVKIAVLAPCLCAPFISVEVVPFVV